MKFFLLCLAFLTVASAFPLRADEKVLFREPAGPGQESVAETSWIRLGGRSQGGLQKEEGSLIWKTKKQSLILNQFLAVSLSAPGSRLTFKCRMRFHQTTQTRHGFQMGVFNSNGEAVPGENPESIVANAFVAYTGYFTAFSLASEEKQGIILYRRKASPETTDASHLFSMNSANAAFQTATHGYSAQDQEDIEFILVFEKTENGLRIEASVNGLSILHTDQSPMTSFDTVALLSLGGFAEEISLSESEVVVSEAP